MRRGLVLLLTWGSVGKVVALLREVLFAAAFGTGPLAAAFKVAQTGTFVPINLLTNDLLTAAFLPRYSALHRDDPRAARSMLWSFLVVLTATTVVLALVLHHVAADVVRLIAPGLTEAALVPAAQLLALLAWSAPLIVVSALLNHALVAAGSYGLLSVRPLIQSAGLVVGTAATVVTGQLHWLASGFLAAWLLYCAVSVVVAQRRGLLSGGTGLTSGVVRRFAGESAVLLRPLLALPLLLQASIVLERVISSLVSDGAVASVDYAKTISESVIMLVAVPLGTLALAALPRLAPEQQRAHLDQVVRLVLLVLVPTSLLLLAAAPLVVDVMYGRGRMDDAALGQITSVLVGLSVGLPAQVLGYVLVRALTAQLRSRDVLACMSLALLLQVPVQLLAVAGLGALALGLGPSCYGVVLVVLAARRLDVTVTLAATCRLLLPPVALSAVWLGLSAGQPPALRCLGIAALLAVSVLVPGRLRGEVVDQVRRRGRPVAPERVPVGGRPG